MMTQKEIKDVAVAQSREFYNIVNGVEWNQLDNILKNLDGIIDYYIEEDFANIDYKDINIGVFKEDDRSVIETQNVEVWDDDTETYNSVYLEF